MHDGMNQRVQAGIEHNQTHALRLYNLALSKVPLATKLAYLATHEERRCCHAYKKRLRADHCQHLTDDRPVWRVQSCLIQAAIHLHM